MALRASQGTGRAHSQATRVLGLALLAALVLFPRLPRGALRHWDEAWYAECSREMLAESSWLTVRWNGAPWFHKPPLTLWATAASFHFLGESEFSARLFAALAGVGVVVVAGALARSLAEGPAERTIGEPDRGPVDWLAAVLLLSIPDFAAYAARGQMDVPLTFWVTAQVACHWLGQTRPQWYLLGGLCLGLGIMTKGSAAGLGLAVSLLDSLCARLLGQDTAFRQRTWWLGLGLAAAVAAPWHLEQAFEHGARFWSEYMERHLGQLFVEVPGGEFRTGGIGFYVDYLTWRQIPWGWGILALVPVGVAMAVWTRARPIVFAACWCGGLFALVSLTRAKSNWYLVPVYPAAAVLAAVLLARTGWWRNGGSCRVLILGGAAAALGASQVAWWTQPANREWESELRSLGGAIDKFVPVSHPLVTLQVPSSRQSIYPTATAFYARRPVHVALGMDHLSQIAARAANPFYLVLHAKLVEETRQRLSQPATGPIWNLDELARQEPVVLVRIRPREP